MNYFVNVNESINNILKIVKPGDTITLAPGVYKEKIKITTPNIRVIGSDKGESIIEYKDYSPKIHKDNKEYITFRTYTVMVTSDNVTISNVTIKNLSTPSSMYGQAVALHVLGDMFKMKDSKLIGAQDTLFLGPLPPNLQERYKDFLPLDELDPSYGRQLFENCYIEGDVDFIFGGGNAIFKDSTIYSISDSQGYFTAPSHNKDQEFGFTFLNCVFDGIKENTMYLGRPWRDYGMVTIIDSTIKNNVVYKSGWSNWNGTERDKTARFSQYNINYDTKQFVSFSHDLTDTEKDKYTVQNIFKL